MFRSSGGSPLPNGVASVTSRASFSFVIAVTRSPEKKKRVCVNTSAANERWINSPLMMSGAFAKAPERALPDSGVSSVFSYILIEQVELSSLGKGVSV